MVGDRLEVDGGPRARSACRGLPLWWGVTAPSDGWSGDRARSDCRWKPPAPFQIAFENQLGSVVRNLSRSFSPGWLWTPGHRSRRQSREHPQPAGLDPAPKQADERNNAGHGEALRKGRHPLVGGSRPPFWAGTRKGDRDLPDKDGKLLRAAMRDDPAPTRRDGSQSRRDGPLSRAAEARRPRPRAELNALERLAGGYESDIGHLKAEITLKQGLLRDPRADRASHSGLRESPASWLAYESPSSLAYPKVRPEGGTPTAEIAGQIQALRASGTSMPVAAKSTHDRWHYLNGHGRVIKYCNIIL